MSYIIQIIVATIGLTIGLVSLTGPLIAIYAVYITLKYKKLKEESCKYIKQCKYFIYNKTPDEPSI